MRLLRFMVLLVLLMPYLYRYVQYLEEHVDGAMHRPLHFLGMVVLTCVLYLFVSREERKVNENWKRKYPWVIWAVFGSMGLLVLGLWAVEIFTGYRAGHIVSVCIYGLPIAVLWVLTVLGVIDRAASNLPAP